jgi:hypothetical protein
MKNLAFIDGQNLYIGTMSGDKSWGDVKKKISK